MKHLLILLVAMGAFAQGFGTYTNPTNGSPVVRLSWLRGQCNGGNVIKDPSLLIYIPLSYPADKAYDCSGNGLSATFSGGVPSGGTQPHMHFLTCAPGQLPPNGTYCGKTNAWAPYFNHSSPNSIVTPSFTIPAGGFTVSAWVNPTSLPNSYGRILETLYSSGFYLGLNSAKTAYEFLVNSSSLPTCAVSGTAQAGVWTMVTGVWNGTSAAIYVNGGASAGGTQATGCTTGYANPTLLTAAMTIGCTGNGGCTTGGAWDGRIQGVRVYNRALSAAEIAAIYNAESTPH